MGAVRIKDQRSLELLLKLIAEESVNLARETVHDGCPHCGALDCQGGCVEEQLVRTDSGLSSTDLEKRRQLDLALQLGKLGGSDGEDESVDEEEDIFADEKPKEPSEEESEEAPPEPEEDPEEPADPDEGEIDDEDPEKITYGMIRDKLNTIRGGKSLKDEKTRSELKSYLRKLDKDERIALHSFLSGIAGILTAGIDAQQAADPSSPPTDLVIHPKDEPEKDRGSDEELGEPEEDDEKEGSRKFKKRKVPRQVTPSGEDTTPPIQVGQKQRTEALRLKVRDLMRG